MNSDAYITSAFTASATKPVENMLVPGFLSRCTALTADLTGLASSIPLLSQLLSPQCHRNIFGQPWKLGTSACPQASCRGALQER